jgi:xylan 1,4-beta-xylosidase
MSDHPQEPRDLAMSSGFVPPPLEPPAPVTVDVDASKTIGPMKPIWRFFGADEPNYAYMKDGQKLIGELGELSQRTAYFRTHNLLTTGDGTPALKWGSTNAYTEDAQGNPVYDWTIVDRIFDTYRDRGVRPYVQIGFMPKALSTHPDPYQHHWTPTAGYDEIYTGWAYPPKDYDKWRELVYHWATHCIERYGKAEVETWYWEVWNEPNIGYWRGTADEFRKLHDHAIAGIRRALPTAKVGGCDAAGGGSEVFQDFLEHCLHGTNHVTGLVGTPIDFISFHAKGAPKFVSPMPTDPQDKGHVRMGISNQLRDIDSACAIIASFPELKDIPIIIGESDPDGCAACQGPQLGYRNTTMYSSYTAASFARKYLIADRHGVNLEGALTWAFEFEDQPLFAGFRVLATGGIDLPVLNVFRMFGLMGTQERISAVSSGQAALEEVMQSGVRGEVPDVGVLATKDGHRIAVLVWNYHDDDLPGPDADVRLSITGLGPASKTAALAHYRIDEKHSNAFTVWKEMGSPAEPTPAQIATLDAAGKLSRLDGMPKTVVVDDGIAKLRFSLPRQAVSLIVIG